MRERILDLLKAENLSPSRMASIMEVQPSNISHIISGRNKPGFDFIEKLLLRFPRINPDWLILGKGEMYRSTTSTVANNTNDPDKEKNSEILFSIIPDTESEHIGKASANDPSYPSSITAPHGQEHSRPASYTPKKSVEKIVVFYSDKSFSEYAPE